MAETRTTPAHAPATTVGAKQDVVVSGKPMVKDEGTISVTYNPGPGDPKTTEVFGKQVKAGEAVDIPARYADKVRGNPYLSVPGEKTYGDDKPKEQKPEEQEEATFEENLARERSEEYLTGRPQFAASPPGEAERVARAQEQARELQEAVEDETDKDKGKPRGGRAPRH